MGKRRNKIIYSIILVTAILLIPNLTYALLEVPESNPSQEGGGDVFRDPTNPSNKDVGMRVCKKCKSTFHSEFSDLCASCRSKEQAEKNKENEQKLENIKGTGGATNPTKSPTTTTTTQKEETNVQQHAIPGEKSDSDGGADITDPITNPDTYKPGENTGTKAASLGKTILSAIQVVGVVIAVGGAMFLGVKYMLGSVAERAEYKSSMVPYIIGIVLLFAGTTIVNIIYNLVQEIG